ncbi:acyltransferase [Aequorivita viscosa]|nr:acyltransferase [Aequorivita viscosa]
MNNLTQYYIRDFRPTFLGLLTRLVYFGSNIKIGNNFRTDSIPKIICDKKAKVEIGNDVEFRRSIELRAHNNSNIKIGSSTRIDRGVRILSTNNSIINIENGARIGLYSVLNGGDSITIGKKTLLSGFVYLQTSMHAFSSKKISIQDQGFIHSPVVLEDDVWIGTHAVIMPGVSLGTGSIVGSNAVVTKSVNNYEVVTGIPAKPIKVR